MFYEKKNNKSEMQLKEITIRNLCQHIKTKISLSKNLTIILAGNGTGKSIFTESISLNPDNINYSDEHISKRSKNLLKSWNDSSHKDKSIISFKYTTDTKKNELLTNSLKIDKKGELKWTKNNDSAFKPKVKFFNEYSSYDGTKRNIEGNELINLSNEMRIGNIFNNIERKYKMLLESIRIYKNCYNNLEKNVDFEFGFFHQYPISDKKKHLKEYKEKIELFFIFIKNNNINDQSSLVAKIKEFNKEEETIFFWIIDSMLLHLSFWDTKNQSYTKKIDEYNYNYMRVLNHIAWKINSNFKTPLRESNFYIKDFEKIKKEVEEHKIDYEFFIKLLTGIDSISRFVRMRLERSIRPALRLVEDKNFDYPIQDLYKLYINDSKIFIKEVINIKLSYYEKSENNKDNLKNGINKMLKKTFLNKKITINNDLYISSPQNMNKNLRASTSELRLIFFKQFLIETLYPESESIDLLVLDDITSSMDYHFIDLLYREIKEFQQEYKKKRNPNLKIIFLTHSDSVFNYFISKELKSFNYFLPEKIKKNLVISKELKKMEETNKKEIYFYNMFQNKIKDGGKYEVLVKRVDHLSLISRGYKTIYLLLMTIYDDKLSNSIRLVTIRKIFEQFAIIMNGSSELGSFLNWDQSKDKYWFKTTLGEIYLTRFAYEMLNLEAHADIYNFGEIQESNDIKQKEIIEEFISIFKIDLNLKYKLNKNK